MVESTEVMVPVKMELREVMLQAEQRSPGGSKPMRRSVRFVPTPDAAQVSDERATRMHEQNVLKRSRVEQEFDEAKRDKKKIALPRPEASRWVAGAAWRGSQACQGCESKALGRDPCDR